MTFLKPLAVCAAISSSFLMTGCDRQQPGAGSGIAPESRSTAHQGQPSGSLALTATVEGESPHFAKVIGKLDVGGKMIEFQDHEGRREMLVELLNAISANIPEARALTAGLNAGELVDLSGLADAAASGQSVKKDGNSWLMRGYDHLPAGPKGLHRLIGAEPFAFESPAFVPAATDLLVETSLDATFLPDYIARVCEAAGHPAQAGALLGQTLPNGESVAQLMEKTRLRLMLGVDVSSWPETPVAMCPVDYFLRISGGEHLLALLQPQLEEALGRPTAIGDRKGWELPMPAIGMQSRSVLTFDDSGTVLLASRADYLNFVDTAEMKLGAWKEYQTATNHFPNQGNLLLYSSPQTPVVLGWLIKQAARNSGDQNTELLVQAAAGYLQPHPLSLCISHEKDGIVTTAETPFSTGMASNSALPLLTGTSVLFVGARAWKRGSDRAACIINCRNVQQAVRSYQNMNNLKGGSAIPWGKIIGPGAFLDAKPTCHAGGTYTFTTSFPPTGKLACTCSNPDHAIPDHSDW